MTAVIILENNSDVDKWYIVIIYAILTQPTVTVLIMNINVLSFRLLLSVCFRRGKKWQKLEQMNERGRERSEKSEMLITNDFLIKYGSIFRTNFFHPVCLYPFYLSPLLSRQVTYVVFFYTSTFSCTDVERAVEIDFWQKREEKERVHVRQNNILAIRCKSLEIGFWLHYQRL